MLKAIIFDFDGVLIESIDIKTKAFAKLFEREDAEVVKKLVAYHLNNGGISRFEKFKYIYKNILHRRLTNKTFRELCQRFSQIVVAEVVKCSYVKGAREFLNNNYLRYKYFVVSATPRRELEGIIKQRGILNYFRGIYGAPEKKTDMAAKIIRNHHFRAKEVLYIGDALSDYTAAKNNSISFIARINNNASIFKGIDCLKIKNLLNLESVLKSNYG